MKTLYDVQQLLKKYGIFIYVGKRIWDIELMQIELKNLFQAGIVDKKTYTSAVLVLHREHEMEQQTEADG